MTPDLLAAMLLRQREELIADALLHTPEEVVAKAVADLLSMAERTLALQAQGAGGLPNIAVSPAKSRKAPSQPRQCACCGAPFRPKGGRSTVCDDCRPEYNRKRAREKVKAWRKANPERDRLHRQNWKAARRKPVADTATITEGGAA